MEGPPLLVIFKVISLPPPKTHLSHPGPGSQTLAACRKSREAGAEADRKSRQASWHLPEPRASCRNSGEGALGRGGVPETPRGSWPGHSRPLHEGSGATRQGERKAGGRQKGRTWSEVRAHARGPFSGSLPESAAPFLCGLSFFSAGCRDPAAGAGTALGPQYREAPGDLKNTVQIITIRVITLFFRLRSTEVSGTHIMTAPCPNIVFHGCRLNCIYLPNYMHMLKFLIP